MFNKIKQVQELRSQAKQIQSALAEESVEGIGAGGQIKISMNGNQEVQKVEISDELMTDKDKLEKGLQEAINDSIKKVQKTMAQKMSQMGGFPGM